MKITKTKLKQIIQEERTKLLKESHFAATAAEEAEKVNAQAGISLVTDPEYWAKIGVHTGEDLAKTLLASSYSDLYKSIHGIRPRWMNFKDMEVKEIQAALDLLDDYEEEFGEPEEYEDVVPQEDEAETEEESWEEYDMPTQSGMGRRMRETLTKLTKSKLQQIIKEEFARLLKEGKKAAQTVGDPPYRERGSTESQAQQKAAGMALSARRGDTPVSKLKGAALDLYKGEITTKDLTNLATLGQKVKQHKSKEPKHLKSLPGHVTPAKD